LTPRENVERPGSNFGVAMNWKELLFGKACNFKANLVGKVGKEFN